LTPASDCFSVSLSLTHTHSCRCLADAGPDDSVFDAAAPPHHARRRGGQGLPLNIHIDIYTYTHAYVYIYTYIYIYNIHLYLFIYIFIYTYRYIDITRRHRRIMHDDEADKVYLSTTSLDGSFSLQKLLHFRVMSARKSVTLSAATPLCSYGIAYHRAYG